MQTDTNVTRERIEDHFTKSDEYKNNDRNIDNDTTSFLFNIIINRRWE